MLQVTYEVYRRGVSQWIRSGAEVATASKRPTTHRHGCVMRRGEAFLLLDKVESKKHHKHQQSSLPSVQRTWKFRYR